MLIFPRLWKGKEHEGLLMAGSGGPGLRVAHITFVTLFRRLKISHLEGEKH